MRNHLKKTRVFSISDYTEKALKRAEYCRDENGVVIGRVPGASGFFAQGSDFEEARANLREVIEGNIVLALQINLPIPEIEGVRTTELTHA